MLLVFSFLIGRRAKKERSLSSAILDNTLENRLETSEPFWSAVTGAALTDFRRVFRRFYSSLNQRSQFVLTSFSFVYSLNADPKQGNAYKNSSKKVSVY